MPGDIILNFTTDHSSFKSTKHILALSVIFALIFSFFTPINYLSHAVASEDINDIPSQLETSDITLDVVEVSYVVIDNINQIKIKSSELPSSSKPIKVYDSSGFLLKTETVLGEFFITIPRKSVAYYATFGSSTSPEIQPFNDGDLWSTTVTIDKALYKHNEPFKVTMSSTYPDETNGKSVYLLDKDDKIINYQPIPNNGNYETTLVSSRDSESYYSVIADSVPTTPGTDFIHLTGIKSTSATVSSTLIPLDISISIDKQKLSVGETAKISYSMSYNFDRCNNGGNCYYSVYLVDEGTGNIVSNNSTWVNGSTDVLYPGKDDKVYKAYVGLYNYRAYYKSDIMNIIAESNEITLEKNPWSVSLISSGTPFEIRENATLTWTTNQVLPPQPYEANDYGVYLYDVNNDVLVYQRYSSLNTGSYSYTFISGPPQEFIVYVARRPEPGQYEVPSVSGLVDIQAISNVATVTRKPWTVSLSTEKAVYEANDIVDFTIEANQNYFTGRNVGLAYGAIIVDVTDNLIYSSTFNYHPISTQGRAYALTDLNEEHQYKVIIGTLPTMDSHIVYNVSDIKDIQAESNIVTIKRNPWVIGHKVSVQPLTYNTYHYYFNVTVTSPQEIYGSGFSTALYNITDNTWMTEFGRGGAQIYPDQKSKEYKWVIGQGAYDPITGLWGMGEVESESSSFVLTASGGPTHPFETTGGTNLSENCSQNCHGDPVNTATGEFWEANEDIVIPQNGPLLGFTRSYATSKKSQENGMGYGWTNNYNTKLKIEDNAKKISIVQENGSESLFEKFSSGSYIPASRVKATLEKDDATGNYIFTRNKKDVFVFDSNGKLITIKDKNDNTLTLSYNTQNQLTKISNIHQQYLIVEWDNNKINKVTDHSGRTVKYAYNTDGELSSVTNPGNITRNYTYDSFHRVATLSNELGGITTNTYASDIDDHIVLQKDPLNHQIAFTYGPNYTQITYPDGLSVLEIYNTTQQLTQKVESYDDQSSSYSYLYTPDGFASTITNPHGRSSYMTYDNDGNITAVQDVSGSITTMTYDDKNNLLTTTNPLGDTAKMSYDIKGNITESLSYAGNKTSYTINNDGTPATITSPNGNKEGANANQYKSTYEYTNGYLSAVKDANGNKNSIVTNALGRPIEMVSPQGNVVGIDSEDYTSRLFYDAMGNITKSVDEKGNITKNTYDAGGNLLTTENALGEIISYTYDVLGNPLTLKNALDHTTAYEYDNRNRLTKIIDAKGKVSEISYDKAGHVIKTKDPLGRETHQTWNIMDQLVTSTDADGKISSFTYDRRSNLLTTKDPLGAITTYEYDLLNRLVTSKDSEDRVSSLAYTKDGLVSQMVQADGLSESQSYDAEGKKISSTNAAGKISTWEYGNLGYLANYKNEQQETESYIYNASGNVAVKTRADNSTVNYSYDERGLLTAVDYPDNDMDISYEYDALRRVTNEKKTGDSAISYAYDEIGNLTSRGPPSQKLEYTYDELGNQKSVKYPSGRIVNYSFNDSSETTNVNTVGLGNIEFTYNNQGLNQETSLPNNTKVKKIYDELGQIKSINLLNSQDVSLYSKTYSYSSTGNIAKQGVATVGQPALEDFTYDPLSRLTSQSKDSDGTLLNGYEYNALGNLTKINSTIQSFDDTGKILNSGSENFSYDTRGNRTKSAIAAESTGDTDYTWNQGNLLHSVTQDNLSIQYSYDASGYLSNRKKDGQSTNSFVWDTNSSIPLLIDDGKFEYIYGIERTPIVQISKDDGIISYLQSDSIGSVVAKTNQDGSLSGETTYSPYGKNLGNALSSFGFAGEWTDADTGYSYLRARWLDTDTGTFLSRDPAVQSTNDAYGYASGNPLSLIDPLGLCSVGAGDLGNLASDCYNFANNSAFLAFNDFAAGFGDTVSFGGTKAIRQLSGTNDQVNTCSTFYTAGEITGTAASFVTPAGVAKAGSTTIAKSFKNTWKSYRSHVKNNEDGYIIGLSGKLPDMEYSRALFPHIAKNIEEAIKAGHPSILTRLHPNSKLIDKNRGAATYPLRSLGKKDPTTKPKGYSIDEYPFASTLEGGKGARAAWVPIKEQYKQGALIKAFNKKYNIKPGDQYNVVIVD